MKPSYNILFCVIHSLEQIHEDGNVVEFEIYLHFGDGNILI